MLYVRKFQTPPFAQEGAGKTFDVWRFWSVHPFTEHPSGTWYEVQCICTELMQIGFGTESARPKAAHPAPLEESRHTSRSDTLC